MFDALFMIDCLFCLLDFDDGLFLVLCPAVLGLDTIELWGCSFCGFILYYSRVQ